MSESRKKLEIKHGHDALTIGVDPGRDHWPDSGYIEIKSARCFNGRGWIGLSKEDLSELANFLKPYDVAVADGGIDAY